MVRRGWRPGAVAAVAVLAGVCMSGPGVPPGGAVSPPGPLPADRYAESAQDRRQAGQASALLVRQCMAGKGHPGFPLDPGFPGVTLTAVAVSTSYGVVDPAAAGRWGYGWDPARHDPSRPQGRQMTDAEYADWPECTAAADRRLMHGVDVTRGLSYPAGRAVVVDAAVTADPRLHAAWAVWSDCLVDAGFPRYSDPVAVYRAPAWHRDRTGNTRHTWQERATAAADVACKLRHGTAGVWHAVQAEKQSADIARHRARYAAALRALRTYRANIAAALAGAGR